MALLNEKLNIPYGPGFITLVYARSGIHGNCDLAPETFGTIYYIIVEMMRGFVGRMIIPGEVYRQWVYRRVIKNDHSPGERLWAGANVTSTRMVDILGFRDRIWSHLKETRLGSLVV